MLHAKHILAGQRYERDRGKLKVRAWMNRMELVGIQGGKIMRRGVDDKGRGRTAGEH